MFTRTLNVSAAKKPLLLRVAPDNVNTTFFGTDITQDADTLPNFPGTSAAAPHVAGVAALVLDANPHLTRSELLNVLTSTAIDLGNPGRDLIYGFGRVDAEAARIAALAVTDVTPPTAQLASPIPLFGWSVDHATLQFSEPLAPASATNVANYTLIAAGSDATFGTADDVSYSVTPSYNDDARTVSLTFTAPATKLDFGQYRLTLRSINGIKDPAGNPLNSGSDQALSFAIAPKSQIVTLEGGTQTDVRQTEPSSLSIRIIQFLPVWRNFHRSWSDSLIPVEIPQDHFVPLQLTSMILSGSTIPILRSIRQAAWSCTATLNIVRADRTDTGILKTWP